MRKIFPFITFLLFISVIFPKISAQEYKSAIGLRLSSIPNISYKQFINERSAIEGLISYGWSQSASVANVGIRYLYHIPVKQVNRLNFYFGSGINVSRYRERKDANIISRLPSHSAYLQGIVGLDYSFSKVPINLSIEWSPQVGLRNNYHSGLGLNNIAIACRYIIQSKK